jgi:hypothetical protein
VRNENAPNSFIRIKSEIVPEISTKRSLWSNKPIERTPYEWTSDEEKEWVSKEMKDQIWSTVASIEKQPLRDTETIYIVLGVESQHFINEDSSKTRELVFYPNVMTVLNGLFAKVLCYLNPEHTKLLVSTRICDLARFLNRQKYRTKYFDVVKRISPLLLQEQISSNLQEDKEWSSRPKDVFVELIPNLPLDKKTVYSKTIVDYLKKVDEETRSYVDEEFIITKLSQSSTEELLKNSNLVFRVTEIPKGMLQKSALANSKKRQTKKQSKQSIRGHAASIKTQNDLPIICVLDSGVNEITQLKSVFIKPQDGFRKFPSFDDDYREHGHGTPVAYLAAFGEDPSIPKARIISYKIYSDNNRLVFPDAYNLAFSKYSSEQHPHRCRIFISSIVFEKYNAPITASIDKSIQVNNVCAVFSAGNIDDGVVIEYARQGIPYSEYVNKYPVQDPAQAINAITIGAIAKKRSSNSISQIDELSPFTRCGVINSSLYDCQKPEFVEHGGNLCKDGRVLGLTSYSKKGEHVEDFAGTSFAAPLFANNLAEIYAKYSSMIKNAETFKAIAQALSYGELRKCQGFGQLKPLDSFDYNLQSLLYSEGKIPLLDTVSDEHFRTNYAAKIRVVIPNLVNSIKMFLVHSDNHFKDASPHLNTFLKVKVAKIPSDYGRPDLFNPNELNRRANMKIFEWAYPSHSMGGIWDFTLIPELIADLTAEDRKATTVRYGCAILTNSKTSSRAKPLTEEIFELNQQSGVII